MSDGPKLYDHKPKKGQLKPKGSVAVPPSSSPPMASPQSPAAPPKETFFKRYKFVWPVLLAVNLALGGYLYLRTRKKAGEEEEELAVRVPPPAEKTSLLVPEKVAPVSSVAPEKVVPVREPIPEHEQRQLYHWILEEKRKVKPSNEEEKKRIDEEKTILKQFIRSKSIPTF